MMETTSLLVSQASIAATGNATASSVVSVDCNCTSASRLRPTSRR